MSARIAELVELTSDAHLVATPEDRRLDLDALITEMRQLQAILSLWLTALVAGRSLAWQPLASIDVEPPPTLGPLTGSCSSMAPPRLLDPVIPMESAAA
jgi:hypothetical protein